MFEDNGDIILLIISFFGSLISFICALLLILAGQSNLLLNFLSLLSVISVIGQLILLGV